ncbi:MAG: redoxin domain-containing protein [Bacteroidota bacterium]|nr:redoxin domain-containing protein [Bacteroidota bacterium]
MLTDVNGKEWRLFEEVGKGKVVILDFFFTTCKPCQKLTPQLGSMYLDYGGDTGEVLILGISDRDDNGSLQAFHNQYAATYPSGGIQGNGDVITSDYISSFGFIGWPTYAVVCPDSTIVWDVRPMSDGLPELMAIVDSCISHLPNQVLLKPGRTNCFIYPQPANDYVRLSLTAGDYLIRLCDHSGKDMGLIYTVRIHERTPLSIPLHNFRAGLYFLVVVDGNHHSTHLKLLIAN